MAEQAFAFVIEVEHGSSSAMSISYYLLMGAGVGAWMIYRGWRGYRVGEHPFCAKCGYNLTGAPAACCPECGAQICDKNTVRGVRIHRWRSLVMGSMLVLLFGLSAYVAQLQIVRDYDWYQLKPTFFVLRDARVMPPLWTRGMPVSDDSTPQCAFYELERRRGLGKLSAADQKKMIEAALWQWGRRKSALEPVSVLDGNLTRFFPTWDSAKLLNKDQLERLVESSVLLSWRSRPQCSIELPIPMEFDWVERDLFLLPYKITLHFQEIRVLHERDPPKQILMNADLGPDEFTNISDADTAAPVRVTKPVYVVRRHDYDGPSPFEDRRGRWRIGLKVSKPGNYRLELHMQITMQIDPSLELTRQNSRRSLSPVDREQVVVRKPLLLSSSSYVVDGGVDQVVHKDFSGEEAQAISKSLVFRSSPLAGGHVPFGGPRIEAQLPLPADVVGEMEIECDGKRYPAGNIELRRNVTGDAMFDLQIFKHDLDVSADNRFYLESPVAWIGKSDELRNACLNALPLVTTHPVTFRIIPKPELAAQTVDIDTIWGEPLMIKVEKSR